MLRTEHPKLNMLILSMAVFTLPFAARASTIHLSDSGWSDSSVGTWDPVTLTGTMMTDVSDTIQIDSDGITLDGNGKTITSDGSTYDCGVSLNGRTGVTIKNLNVQGFFVGISLCNSTGNTLTNNTCSSNTWAGINLEHCSGNNITGNTPNLNERGINLDYSDNNTLTDNISELNIFGIHLGHCSGNNITGNTANSNDRGINLDYSNDNTLTDNISESNVFGIHLEYCSRNIIIGNTANSNERGINLDYSNDNTLTDNTSELNSWSGIRLFNSSDNTITSNTNNSSDVFGICLEYSSGNNLTENNISNNNMGIQLIDCSENKIYNNNFISNTTHAFVSGGSGNIFNKSAPIGGNYWSDWTSPDGDGDGFVDYPYVFAGGQDDLPWVLEDGWLPTPVADIDVSPLTLDFGKVDLDTSSTATVTLSNEGSADLTVGAITLKAESSSDISITAAPTLPVSIEPLGTVNIAVTYTPSAIDLSSGVLEIVSDDPDEPVVEVVLEGAGVVVDEKYTPPGQQVIVELMHKKKGKKKVTVKYDEVLEEGITKMVIKKAKAEETLPENYKLGDPAELLELETTATVEGEITVWIDYSDTLYEGSEKKLKMYHKTADGPWTEITLLVDTEVKEVVGKTDSFSDFGIFEVDAFGLINGLINDVLMLNLQQGISNSLDAKLSAALQAVDDFNASNDIAAVNTLEAFVAAVRAQSSNKIPEADADELIAVALEIIAILSSQ
jgi:parallel beta-helix repeat protein